MVQSSHLQLPLTRLRGLGLCSTGKRLPINRRGRKVFTTKGRLGGRDLRRWSAFAGQARREAELVEDEPQLGFRFGVARQAQLTAVGGGHVRVDRVRRVLGTKERIAFWIASVMSNVGTAMFDTASGWLITGRAAAGLRCS